MTIEPSTHETRLATIVRQRPDVLLIRYHEGITFDNEGIAEVIGTCERIAGREEFGVVSVLPENGEMSLAAMQQEHSTEGFGRRVRAHAIVALGSLFRKLTEIHYNYHPQDHEVRMFGTIEEAVTWVQARLGGEAVA
jgi:hypothetical protein